MSQPEKPRSLVLLVNLGTPDEPTPKSVGRYLREFLADPRVVEIPRIIWWFILNLIIVPFRSAKSAAAYRSIWSERGSPLLVHSRDLCAAVQEHLSRDGSEAPPQVRLAMRYGKPNIPGELLEACRQGIERVLVLPLYPQYAAATTASTWDALAGALAGLRHIPEVHFLSDYHDDPAYIDAVATSVSRYWKANGPAAKLLFSFHGLPERSRALGDPYHDQCQTSAALIAARLGLDASQWQVVFQSRFGPAEWLKPYCVDVLASLPGQGATEIDVICPGFAADCLETLEEIAIANRELFMNAGGRRYRYIPALNSSPAHVAVVAGLIQRWLA